VPLARLGPVVSAAAPLRPRTHRALAEAWEASRGGAAAHPNRSENTARKFKLAACLDHVASLPAGGG